MKIKNEKKNLHEWYRWKKNTWTKRKNDIFRQINILDLTIMYKFNLKLI